MLETFLGGLQLQKENEKSLKTACKELRVVREDRICTVKERNTVEEDA